MLIPIKSLPQLQINLLHLLTNFLEYVNASALHLTHKKQILN